MIQLKNVSFTYGDKSEEKNGVEDINLSIREGEFIAVAGVSGCGKTTVTRLINRLVPECYNGRLTGEIIMDKKLVNHTQVHEISKKVGSVFQNPKSQFFNINSTNELAFILENRAVSKDEIIARLNRTVNEFGIKPLMNRNMFHLSGGEKQKIACASVSIADTNIMVLDEPTSNLDVEAIQELKEILIKWKAAGKTIIIAEHRLYFLKDLLDRLLIMKEGRIVEEFTAGQIQDLSADDMKERGLRAFDMAGLKISRLPSVPSAAALRIEVLKFTYKNSQQGIHIKDVELNKGDITAIIGKNGAGKSTFVRCLCGLEKSCQSNVLIDGRRCSLKEQLKNCYLVMQDVNHQLFMDSVYNEVIFNLYNKRNLSESEKSHKVEEILAALDLTGYKESHPMALSGGQKQRAAIAAALSSDKNIVIFDEPTSGLDYIHMEKVAGDIKKLARSGKTILIITHDLELILNSCNKIVQIEQGMIKDQYELNNKNEKKLKEFFQVRSHV